MIQTGRGKEINTGRGKERYRYTEGKRDIDRQRERGYRQAEGREIQTGRGKE